MDTTPVVAIVDDDEAVRDALALLIGMRGYRTTLFPSAEAFLSSAKEAPPTCVVADVRMSGMSGIDMLGTMKRQGISSPVIIITGHGNVPMAVAALKGGAFDFIEKPFQDMAILERIGEAISRTETETQRRDARHATRERMDRLSQRERQVMHHVVEGMPNKVIANHLGISVRTVEIHRARVMEKMQARSLSELVRMTLTFELEK